LEDTGYDRSDGGNRDSSGSKDDLDLDALSMYVERRETEEKANAARVNAESRSGGGGDDGEFRSLAGTSVVSQDVAAGLTAVLPNAKEEAGGEGKKERHGEEQKQQEQQQEEDNWEEVEVQVEEPSELQLIFKVSEFFLGKVSPHELTGHFLRSAATVGRRLDTCRGEAGGGTWNRDAQSALSRSRGAIAAALFLPARPQDIYFG
jgi:hypothetical protein